MGQLVTLSLTRANTGVAFVTTKAVGVPIAPENTFVPALYPVNHVIVTPALGLIAALFKVRLTVACVGVVGSEHTVGVWLAAVGRGFTTIVMSFVAVLKVQPRLSVTV
jgi:hypothetical protein